jgi:hypothetical protein
VNREPRVDGRAVAGTHRSSGVTVRASREIAGAAWKRVIVQEFPRMRRFDDQRKFESRFEHPKTREIDRNVAICSNAG